MGAKRNSCPQVQGDYLPFYMLAYKMALVNSVADSRRFELTEGQNYCQSALFCLIVRVVREGIQS